MVAAAVPAVDPRPERIQRRLTMLGWIVLGEAVLLLAVRLVPADRLAAPIPAALGVALLTALALAWWLTPRRTLAVRAEWRVAATVPLGEEVAVGALVSTPAGTPPLVIQATDPASGRATHAIRLKALPAAAVKPTWSVRFPRRGLIVLPPLRVACDQPFGLVSASRTAGESAEVIVLPLLGAVRKGFTTRLQAWLGARTETAERGLDELDHLRGYRAGDPPRLVHWRASARLGRLVVVERQDLVCRRVAVLVDVRLAAGKRFERLICAAATVVDALCTEGWTVSVHGPFTGTETGVSGDRERLLAVLALAAPSELPPGNFLPPGLSALVICPGALDLVITPPPLVLDLDSCDELLHLPRRVRS
jgi:uncharacterized protein (DUF58 family)